MKYSFFLKLQLIFKSSGSSLIIQGIFIIILIIIITLFLTLYLQTWACPSIPCCQRSILRTSVHLRTTYLHHSTQRACDV